ncbi:MAG: alanine dehydrogenase [Vicingaceae bacterium]
MSPSDDILKSLAKGFMPQAETLEIPTKKSDLFIGMPKEISIQEKRVPLIPDAVALLVNHGHRIRIESGAGEAAKFSDNDYSEAGAEITSSTQEIYKADLILKVEPPTLEELDLMQQNQTLISALQLPIQPKNFLEKLIKKKVTAIAYDFIKDEDEIFPIVRAMSEIAGTSAIMIAAENLSNNLGGQGQMFGGISGVTPTNVVILGSGTVGEFSARSALGLGATVQIFNNSIYSLRRLQNNIGQRISTSIIQPNVLLKALRRADVVIGAMRASDGGRTPVIVSENMVMEMKVGSVIVDVSIDKGGCFETSEVTTHENPTFIKHDVIHYCVPNIASRVAKTASIALSNVFAPALLEAGQHGGIESSIRKYKGIQNGIYVYNGILTNKYLAETFNLPYKNLQLLISNLY